jgi:hypothetical protein
MAVFGAKQLEGEGDEVDPTVATWLTRIAILLELTGFLLAPWQFLDEQAFERLDDRANHYLRGVAYRTRAILVIAVIVALILIGFAFLLQSKTEVREGSLTFSILFVASSPLLGVMVASGLKGPLDRALFASLKRLAERKELRLRLLGLGAILLVMGALFQLVATF